MLRLFTVLLVCLSWAGLSSGRVDRNAGHPHRGAVPQYEPGPFKTLTLSKSDLKVLASGKSVMKQIPAEGGSGLGGRAICVQDVEAPKKAVWNQILDLNSYKGKVAKLKECKNYEVTKNRDGSTTIKTKMVIGVIPGYSYEYYCDHKLHAKKDSLVWSLDYDKRSDFDDVAGHWHLEENSPTSTRVFYACDIKFFGKVPGPVMNILQKQALKTATSWVKKESESHPAFGIPSQFAYAF